MINLLAMLLALITKLATKTTSAQSNKETADLFLFKQF